jgi:phage gpG-like protein
MEIDFSINDDQLRSVFSNFDRPTRPLMTAIALFIADEAKIAIETQTSPDGSKFAALNPRYQARKTALFDGSAKIRKGSKVTRPARNTILQYSSTMKDSISADATNDTAIVKTNRPVGSYDLGAIHQFGAPRRNIPARSFFPITDQGDLLPDALEEVQGLVANYFTL